MASRIFEGICCAVAVATTEKIKRKLAIRLTRHETLV
jgi:hypothetical protein